MSRPKGSKNKQALAVPDTVSLTTEERVKFIAGLIVDRIIEDKASGFLLLKKIRGLHGTKSTDT